MSELILETENFPVRELRCHCGQCEYTGMDGRFMERIEVLRARYGHPLQVTSGYRCPYYNEIVSSSGIDGPHTLRVALDFKVSGVHADELLEIVYDMGFAGKGVRQHGPWDKRMIHVDDVEPGPTGKRPRTWTY